MAAQEQRVQIISNESNTVTEIEASSSTPTAEPNTMAGKKEASEGLAADTPTPTAQRSHDEVATNDGALVETLDTAFHYKPGIAEGKNLSGSSRADYYEASSYGKSDAEEELDALNNNEG